jgi:hypothetical protein
MTTMTRMKAMRPGVLALCLLAAALGPVSAQETFRLVAAQVVTATERPPVLKLTANGPIAFRVVDDESAQGPADSHRLVARLYGVVPGDVGVAAGVAPFSLTVRGEGSDTIITVSVAGDATLGIRSASRANEVEVFSR